jgi:predicted phage tail protein
VSSHLEITKDRSQPESPPLGNLFERLADDLKLLARQEVDLAKHELGDSFDQAKQQAATLALGAAALGAGLLVLLAAAVLGLALLMPAWLAALIVGGLVSMGGAVLVLSGKAKLSRVNFKPERTLESMSRDVSAIKRAAT